MWFLLLFLDDEYRQMLSRAEDAVDFYWRLAGFVDIRWSYGILIKLKELFSISRFQNYVQVLKYCMFLWDFDVRERLLKLETMSYTGKLGRQLKDVRFLPNYIPETEDYWKC